MAQPFLHYLWMDPGRKQQRRMSVPQIVKSNLRQFILAYDFLEMSE
jgi:hypothetical protein